MRASGRAVVAAVLVGIVATGCGNRGRNDTAADGPTTATVAADDTAPPPTDAAPPGTTVDPGTLPQTRDHPGTTDARFASGVQALWQGIVDDDPERAMAFFFPLSAYRQVKAVSDPTRDWQSRLVAAYTSDVHALHRQLGAHAADARLVGLDLPDAAATWVDPGQEYNKLGYWRVYGSALRYSVGGQTFRLPIYSLISWRGDWYVVHVTHP
jgi:hypothetical protein